MNLSKAKSKEHKAMIKEQIINYKQSLNKKAKLIPSWVDKW